MFINCSNHINMLIDLTPSGLLPRAWPRFMVVVILNTAVHFFSRACESGRWAGGLAHPPGKWSPLTDPRAEPHLVENIPTAPRAARGSGARTLVPSG